MDGIRKMGWYGSYMNFQWDTAKYLFEEAPVSVQSTSIFFRLTHGHFRHASTTRPFFHILSLVSTHNPHEQTPFKTSPSLRQPHHPPHPPSPPPSR